MAIYSKSLLVIYGDGNELIFNTRFCSNDGLKIVTNNLERNIVNLVRCGAL